jgi:hypothetical protein
VNGVNGEYGRQKQSRPDGAHAIAANALLEQAHLVIAQLKPQPPTALSALSGLACLSHLPLSR